jgi:uncharacterized membrane protein YfhO
VVPDIKQARQSFISDTFDPLDTAIISASPKLESCSSDEENVHMPIHQPNYIHLTARMVCRGIMIVTDPWFPGWRATVDGKPAEILEVDGGVRGIVLDKGLHQIDMKYRPWSVLLGALMTLFAGAVVVLGSVRK